MTILNTLKTLAENVHHKVIGEAILDQNPVMSEAIKTNSASLIKSCFNDNAAITAHRSSIVHVTSKAS